MANYPKVQLHIDGEWRDARSGKVIEVINPATEEVIGTVAHAGKVDLDEALEAAERGFAIWRKTSVFERYKLMRRAADILRSRADAIAAMMTAEQGKPLPEAKMETLAGADIIEWMAEEGRRAYGRVIPARAEGIYQLVLREPVGPVAAFTPWNFPINQVVRKLSAALATGNSIIVKAPEETPASPAELIRAFVDAGIPKGVIGLVYGVPAEISSYLIPHPTIRKITFTGSTPVGKMLAGLAGQHMKRATMELGGHAPAIVFDDADIQKAAKTLAVSKFRNAGQVCVSPTRFLVQERSFDEFLDTFTSYAKSLKVGNGMDEGVAMGPLANDRRVPTIETLVQDAVQRGAKLQAGGNRIGNKGYFYEPTVISDLPLDARAMNEEPFGPLALVNRFSDFDEVVQESNRLPFGLAAYAFTGSATTAQRIAASVETGMMTINHLGLALPEVPFGGVKDSGYGSEGGSEALEPYLVTKFVTQAGL
ncbi:succinate-semialdehyde dehydrogenase / glutarate-semialdehyde dehydrogenase [Roseomonas rosea]|uniref:Succinate-semialdehyde dehydrogenase / glutarate-semialdehyde dehydrogenase n=1 Tax=Muricoccus roseus TaxID=198092 RepID=A0A1M6EF92_9PROT|nr:NAD-dependent succinate-semialdehyde dehydrogenase [Roseomonas rosea]SHI84049.1 succinate-semialdehyde dehydrogenase / glutarate-semialdehyde dehydrogenase [Roseomonas rosea]